MLFSVLLVYLMGNLLHLVITAWEYVDHQKFEKPDKDRVGTLANVLYTVCCFSANAQKEDAFRFPLTSSRFQQFSALFLAR